MKAIFKANIEENGLGGWLIRITDTSTNEEMCCNTFEEFESILEYIGSNCQEGIEIKWSKADNLTQEHFFEVKQCMAKLNKELQNNG